MVQLECGAAHSEHERGRWSGQRKNGLHQNFATFHKLPQFIQLPQAMGKNSKRNAPKASDNKSSAVGRPTGFERCWCRGFKTGCGLIRWSEMHQMHAIKERKLREDKSDKCHAHF